MTDLSHITLKDLEAWARKQDRTRSNPYVEVPAGISCKYVGDNEEHCIAGQFWRDHGVPLETLSSFDEYEDEVADLIGTRELHMNSDVALKLRDLQRKADNATDPDSFLSDEPWGYAIDEVFGEAS